MKKFGFGCMRLPCNNDEVEDIDLPQVFEMVDTYIESGFNYFDTAYGYHNGLSEVAVKKAVIERYPRNEVLIADKLPVYMLKPSHNLEEIFQEQKERCGVEYFDYYMLHNITNNFYNGIVPKLNCFEFVEELKQKGEVKHIGISFHDDADTLEKILKEHPSIEFVQLQINYLDWDNEGIQSRKCYEVARKYNKDVIVMEPLKGGTLVNIPDKASEILNNYSSDLSIASWGIRFAASLDGVISVLSGVSNLEQLEDNLSYMKNFKPLTDDELKIIDDVVEIIKDSIAVPCTGCDYCLDSCPTNIPISKFFALYNDAKQAIEVQFLYYFYYDNLAKKNAPASMCLQCGECEKKCTQHINIIDELKNVEELLEVDLESML
ncbi:aldo/keto reductase [uncultured Methanobrevibacter sp.]|uniref:aldo/keto reductase n=1 Tax=uncultured Methanobrevibacter sp. TaxID=253161 RepID=UPI0026116EF1|nr:aldo/keto reductase [uncultured Methanobrevibacter sp.]